MSFILGLGKFRTFYSQALEQEKKRAHLKSVFKRLSLPVVGLSLCISFVIACDM